MSDHHEIFTQFFLDPELIFSSHTMFINTSTKEFTLVDNAIPSHGIAIKHFLCYKMVIPMFTKNSIIFLKIRHIPF